MSFKFFFVCSLAVLAAYVAHGTLAANVIQPRVDLGGRCNSTLNCTVPNSVCNNKTKICECDTGYENQTNKCLIKLNATCNFVSRLCNRTGAVCKEGKCVCDTALSYIMSPDGTQCVKLALQINSTCEYESQCKNLLNTTCVNGKCYCKDINNKPTTATECKFAACQSVNSCIGSYVECNKGNCVCTSGAVMTPSRCMRAIDTIGAECNSNTDICRDADGNHDLVVCLKGKCTCIPSYKPDKKNKRCVSRASSSAIASVALLLLTGILSFRP